MCIKMTDMGELGKAEMCIRWQIADIDEIQSTLFASLMFLSLDYCELWDMCHCRLHTQCSSPMSASHASHEIISGHGSLSPFYLHIHLYCSSRTSQPFTWLATENTLSMTSLNCLVFFVANKLKSDFFFGWGERVGRNPTVQGLENKLVTVLNYAEKWLGPESRIPSWAWNHWK